jgi:hypothetical protein
MDIHVDGKKVTYIKKNGRKTTLRHRTVEQAEAAVYAIRECEANPHMTLGEFDPVWSKYHARVRLLETSQAVYRSAIDNDVLPYFGDVPVEQITENRIMSRINECLANGDSGSTVTEWFGKFRAILGRAAKWDLIDENPALKIDGLFFGVRPKLLAGDEEQENLR